MRKVALVVRRHVVLGVIPPVLVGELFAVTPSGGRRAALISITPHEVGLLQLTE